MMKARSSRSFPHACPVPYAQPPPLPCWPRAPPRQPTARPRVAAPPSSARSKTTSRRPRRTATTARKPACAARWPRRTAPIAACRTSAKPTCAENKVAEREGELKQARAKGKPERSTRPSASWTSARRIRRRTGRPEPLNPTARSAGAGRCAGRRRMRRPRRQHWRRAAALNAPVRASEACRRSSSRPPIPAFQRQRPAGIADPLRVIHWKYRHLWIHLVEIFLVRFWKDVFRESGFIRGDIEHRMHLIGTQQRTPAIRPRFGSQAQDKWRSAMKTLATALMLSMSVIAAGAEALKRPVARPGPGRAATSQVSGQYTFGEATPPHRPGLEPVEPSASPAG